jgi:hypothetical protein
MKKTTLEEFVVQANLVHNGKYSYLEPYIGNHDPLTIICPIHGAFQQRPDVHLRGSGCFKCFKLTPEKFVERSNIIHNGKYSYPESYLNCRSKLTIVCPIHGPFQQKPITHLEGKGCRKCGNIKRGDRFRSSYQEFVKKSLIVHKGKYKYPENQTYTNCYTLLEIECSIHGIFKQKSNIHLSGHGCKQCVVAEQTKTSDQFVVEANQVHHNRFSYPEPYINIDTPINIQCSIHGLFRQRPRHHLDGAGCPKCSPNTNKGNDKFLLEARQVHGNKYFYVDEYINIRTLMKIECPIHGIFEQTPNGHLYGYGCPKCGQNNVSKPEVAWLDSLGIPKEYRQITIKLGSKKWIRPDAVDEEKKIVYEFYGDYYHGHPQFYSAEQENKTVKKTFGELYQATLLREQLIQQAGYNLISIWESDWNSKLNNTQ